MQSEESVDQANADSPLDSPFATVDPASSPATATVEPATEPAVKVIKVSNGDTLSTLFAKAGLPQALFMTCWPVARKPSSLPV